MSKAAVPFALTKYYEVVLQDELQTGKYELQGGGEGRMTLPGQVRKSCRAPLQKHHRAFHSKHISALAWPNVEYRELPPIRTVSKKGNSLIASTHPLSQPCRPCQPCLLRTHARR